jgi:EAL domain-containing protein (putative c-di-GMP-specific phosphodiesterase class I)/PAS domain-containing protein
LKFLGPALALLLGLMLLATIYYTLLDLQWVAFLAGVLFAAVAATTSQVSKAQWQIKRRTLQLERAKAALVTESARSELAVQTEQAATARMHLVNDALSAMILFVDGDDHCTYHNRSFQLWCGRTYDTIDGLPLHAVVSDEIYRDLKLHSTNLQEGNARAYAAAWMGQDGRREQLAVTLLQCPAGATPKPGFSVLIEQSDVTPGGQLARLEETNHNVAIVSQDGVETVYLQSMTEQLTGGDDPRGRLVRALQDDHFLLFAQAITPLSTDAHCQRGVEVLLRLQEEEDNFLPPGGFFPVAEHYNLMGEIDRWVVHNVLKWHAAKRLKDSYWRAPIFCVNLSSTTLCDPAFPGYVKRQLEFFETPAGNLCFEIAEFDLLNHHAKTRVMMNAARLLGCKFTVDGFGAAKVSFAPLNDLRFDFLKMDSAVTQNLLTERADYAKTRSIVLACEKLGVQTIAGFVESEPMLATLRTIGVDYAQGFHIGKPGPIALIS